MRYVYVFLCAAVTGMFTIAGMAGSYSRMLAKAETINHLRDELAMSRSDYQHLEKSAHEKDVQAASLGSLATEVSAIYGLTAGKLTLPHGLSVGKFGKGKAASVAADAAKAPLKDEASSFSDDSYYKSLGHLLRAEEHSDAGHGHRAARPGACVAAVADRVCRRGHWRSQRPRTCGPSSAPSPAVLVSAKTPSSAWVKASSTRVSTSARRDGTPVHRAPPPAASPKLGPGTGYGREVEIDHGNGVTTIYGPSLGLQRRRWPKVW